MGKEMTAKALAGIGECYLKKQDFESGQNYFKKSIEAYPENELIAYNVGEIYFSNRKLGEPSNISSQQPRLNLTGVSPITNYFKTTSFFSISISFWYRKR